MKHNLMAEYRTATEKIKLKTNTDHSFFFRSEAASLK